MPEKQRLCFGFPPWLVQVGANLVTRHPNRIAPIPATNEASSAGCNDATSFSFSGQQSWRPSTLRKRKPRLQSVIRQCRAKFAPTWASQGGKQEDVRRGGAIVWFPNLLPPGRARVESLCRPTGMSIPTLSKVACPKPVLETPNSATSKLARRANVSGRFLGRFNSRSIGIVYRIAENARIILAGDQAKTPRSCFAASSG